MSFLSFFLKIQFFEDFDDFFYEVKLVDF